MNLRMLFSFRLQAYLAPLRTDFDILPVQKLSALCHQVVYRKFIYRPR